VAATILQKTQMPGWFDGLPPRECWTVDPFGPDFQPIETPVDDRGLVDETALIRDVCTFIIPSFLWPDNPSYHHKGWKHEWYAQLEAESDGVIPALQFCELPSQGIYTPRMFHTLIHKVTRPPLMPSPDVMRHQIAAWRVAHNLLSSIEKTEKAEYRSSVELAKPDNSTQREADIRAYQEDKFLRHFKGRLAHLDVLERVPKDHWLFNPNDDPRTILRTIQAIRAKSYRRMGSIDVRRTRRGKRISLAGIAVGGQLAPAT